MCGIAGFWSPSLSASARREAVRGMTLRLAHRGPDADGHWVPADTPVALGHRRLSILDLSATGAQPMWSASGRFIISFNGEIYNFRALRERLHAAGAVFRGTSDTEVLLAGFEAWGIAATLREATGMFALAVWDVRDQELTLARDRVGEKPLYYGVCADSIVFASELKAIRHHPHFEGEIDRGAVGLLMRFGYVPAPYSIYRHIGKVAPGTLLRVPASRWPRAADHELLVRGRRRSRRNRQADQQIRRGADRRARPAAPRRGRRPDGGRRPPRCLPLRRDRFDDRRRDDAGAVEGAGPDVLDRLLRSEVRGGAARRAVAAHLRTIHTEHYLSAEESMRVIDQLPSMYDEPFADWSQIPTYLVSRARARCGHRRAHRATAATSCSAATTATSASTGSGAGFASFRAPRGSRSRGGST